MRLTSIKLSGFKSFADPTHFQLPGQLVGVVGPNGCGKSNIIDAVRWVLGESRASELRGESMQDVIFNGTNTRKPASRASVELVFDNSSHRAGGQWNQYEEVAVRRVLTRDGTSSYFINNQAVRRRDVQDVFLGTGLGPRAYAIIGQGTISRIIESRPEELRLFLEEAAGVSKYKERRRETENRIHDTEENLTRVTDILRELNANLDKLERQAEVAQRYQGLQADVTLKQHQQWFLKRAESLEGQSKLAAEVLEATNQLEASMADLRRAEADLESIRQSHYAAGDGLNAAQGLLYEASTEVGKLEAEIRFVVEGRVRAEARIAQIAEQLLEWQTRADTAAQHQLDLASMEAGAQEHTMTLAAQLEDIEAQTPELEAALAKARGKVTAQHTQVTQVQQQIQVLAAEQRSLDEQARNLELRRERLTAQQKEVASPDTAGLASLSEALAMAKEVALEGAARLEDLREQVPASDEARRLAQEVATSESAKLADTQARLDALQTLQAQVIANDRLKPWLAKHGLDHLTALWTKLHIEKGWEAALEAALQSRMGALEVSRLEMLTAFAADTPPAKLSFYAPTSAQFSPSPRMGLVEAQGVASTGSARTGGDSARTGGDLARTGGGVARIAPLASLIKTSDANQQSLMLDWLHGCWTVDSLDAALAARESLAAGEVIYTPEGHAVTRTSISFYAAEGEQAGLLARAQEIENLDKQARAQSLMAQDARTALQRAETHYAEVASQLGMAQSEASKAQAASHDLEIKWTTLSRRVSEAQARSSQLAADIAEIDVQLADLQERRVTLEAQFEDLDIKLGEAQEVEAAQGDGVIEAERQLNALRDQHRALEREQQEATFQGRSLVARKEELARNIQLGIEQTANLAREREQLDLDLLRMNDAAAQSGLQAALALKLERETGLAAKRSLYDDLTQKLRATDERRMSAERALEPQRGRISDLQLKEQAIRLGAQQYEQLLLDAKADLAAVEASIAAGNVKLWGLSGEIERLNQAIQSLGAINLAALDELAAARERKTFLDSQMTDLTEALTTLQDAIKKIDAETRDLLGNTFNQVNEQFGLMFPKLFGGGQAKLMMTGEEILDAGIQVIAQPPGKKNQTIHLLSGGEKALTAIALVFAIFMLNPAPFCLLDEVDAPLDDANTERYAKLVASMSEQTQFLFISHNKIAMEMAKQLIGVTMQEQGVSRIVAVDMEAAVSMIE
ncbi:MAG: chromosome segregation protein SMC [Cytophagales bacterium]|nr:chromosome segregation protein SMC [Cytophagales bacterium]